MVVHIAPSVPAQVDQDNERVGCEAPKAAGDFQGDGVVDVSDLLYVIANWGEYDVNDLLSVIANWNCGI